MLRQVLILLMASVAMGSYYGADPCANNPCQNGYDCLYIGGNPGYMCGCVNESPLIFFGLNCDQPTNYYCSHHTPCQNMGACTNGAGDAYSCTCKNGYRGNNCEIPPPECITENPCQSGVCACAGEPSTYFGNDCRDEMVCFCYPDRNGTLCDQVVQCPTDPAYDPCKNNGTCTPTQDGNSFTCDCSTSDGFTGPTCEDGGPNSTPTPPPQSKKRNVTRKMFKKI